MGGSGPQERDWDGLPMDANVDHDPEAADVVFAASDNITMVGTNLSPYIELPASGLDQLKAAPMRTPPSPGASRSSTPTSTNAGQGAAGSNCGTRWRPPCCSIRP